MRTGLAGRFRPLRPVVAHGSLAVERITHYLQNFLPVSVSSFTLPAPLTRVLACCDLFWEQTCQCATSKRYWHFPRRYTVPRSSLTLWTTLSDAFKFSADTMGVGSSSYLVEMDTLGSGSTLSVFIRSVSRTAPLKLLASSSKNTGQLNCGSHFHANTTENTRDSDGLTASLR